MRIRNLLTSLIAIFCLVVALTGTGQTVWSETKPERSRTHQQPPSEDKYEVVASLPVGDGGIHYENVDVPDMERTGPASFRVAPDGTFVVADTSTNRILFVSPESVVQQDLQVQNAGGIVDLALAPDGGVFALDLAQETIHRLRNGTVQDTINLPDDARERGLFGISVDQYGQPLLEMKTAPNASSQGGESLKQTLLGEAASVSLEGQDENDLQPTREKRIGGKRPVAPERPAAQGISVSVPDLSDVDVDRTTGEIRMDDKQATIKVTNNLAGLEVIGVNQKGHVFVSVLEMLSDPAITVDETIHHYDKNLRLLEVARVPLAERFTHVERGVDLAQDGNVYAMIPRTDRLDIVRLNFKTSVKAILAPSATKEDQAGVLYAHAPARVAAPLAACSRTRSDMVATANEYLNNTTTLNSKNVSGKCSGRTAPRYLKVGSNKSVAYDWGGNDTVADYKTFMSKDFQAGDILTCDGGCSETCSKGVDCSGFTGRVWGESKKYSTDLLKGISTLLSDTKLLQRGDILNDGKKHVVIFNGMINGGVNAWESTTYGNVDRVFYGPVSWDRLSGYKPYKYNGVCETGNVSLSTNCSSVIVSRGATANCEVYAFTSDGFRGSVNLYALNLPSPQLSGTGFSYETLNVTSNYTWFVSTLKVVTNSKTPLGTHNITIEGRSGARLSKATIKVIVVK